jgi:hypothetical protein
MTEVEQSDAQTPQFLLTLLMRLELEQVEVDAKDDT